MLIDSRLDPPLLIIDRLSKTRLKPPGDIEPRILESAKEQPFDFRIIQSNSQLPTEFTGHLHDLSGITHLLKFYARSSMSSSHPARRAADLSAQPGRPVHAAPEKIPVAEPPGRYPHHSTNRGSANWDFAPSGRTNCRSESRPARASTAAAVAGD